MNHRNALKRLPTLTDVQLDQVLQTQLASIESYTRSIINYPKDRFEKYGAPYMNKLKTELQAIRDEFARRE